MKKKVNLLIKTTRSYYTRNKNFQSAFICMILLDPNWVLI